MGVVGQKEEKTQQRVVQLFRERLGYDYLGDWTHRDCNHNIEEDRGAFEEWVGCVADLGRKIRYRPPRP
jgi:type I restriction enzyme R subunit